MAFLACLGAAGLLAACGGGSGGFKTSGSNTAPVSLLLTAPLPTGAPQGVDVLAFTVSLTSAVLNNGSKQLVTSQAPVEVTRLQAETALLGQTNITAGTYSTMTLTFANPTLVFRNDNTTGNVAIWGSAPCAAGQICTVNPSGVNAKLTATLNLPASNVTLTTGTPVALQLNLDFGTMMTSTTQADLTDNTTISLVTPATQNAPFATMEDVVGTVTAVNSNQSTFTLQTGQGAYTLATTTSATAPTVYLNSPSTTCTNTGFACLAIGQIVSANMALQSTDGSLLATQVIFEDATSSKQELEGVVIAKPSAAPPAQFDMVLLQETPAVAGLAIGTVVQVAPNSSPAAAYDVDNLGASTATNSYSFQNAFDVIVGQELQVRMAGLAGTQVNTDQIRLRSSRFSGLISSVSFPAFNMAMLPLLFAAGGYSQVQVRTDTFQPPSPSFTEYGGTAQNFSNIAVQNFVTARAQLFANGLTPASVATKVIEYHHQ